ncbi:MAG: inositol monophosphatase family protein [Actinomycetes bacterium]
MPDSRSLSSNVPPADPDMLANAVDILRAAGTFTLQWFGNPSLDVLTKSDGTPVTEADRGAERLIRERLSALHPEDSVLGEELDDYIGSSSRTWIVDPIDGTKAFTRGVPLYSNLLAVVDDYGPLIGVINLPALSTTVYAGRGLGCFRDGRPVRVSDRSTPSACVLSTSGFGTWEESSLLGVKRAGFELRTWGDGYGYAMVACGALDAMVDPQVSLWDIAPMPVIFAEAGGRFTGTDGNDVSLVPGSNVSGVATNGVVHDAVIAALAAI